MKKYIYALSVISAAFIVGCGSGSSVSDQQFTYDTSSIFGFSKEVTYKNYSVKVDDDPIIGAKIKATNCESAKELNNGEYLLEKCVGKPLYIEVKDGKIKNTNVTQTFPLILNVSQAKKEDGFVVTPLTSILATASEDEIEEFAEKLGVSKEDLFSDKNDKLKKLFPKINTILIASATSGAITNKVKFLEIVRKNVLDEISLDAELNVTKVLNTVKDESIKKPNFFGIVVVDENIDETDPLEYLSKLQNSKNIKFFGIVFDKPIKDAQIDVIDLDSNKTYELNVTSKNVGEWSVTIDSEDELYNIIMNKEKNHLLQFIAKNDKIKLTSTISTKELRDLIEKTKVISPSEEKRLIISNVTTALDAFLDNKGNLNSSNYEESLKETKVYYKDKILKLSALIKAVVDENSSMDANDTYDLAKKSIGTDYDINTSYVDVNDSEIEVLENNISNNTILSSQLNEIKTYEENGFEDVAKRSNYTFYRLLAYYDKDKFIREYTKIIVYPSYYETQTCHLENDSTLDWVCENPRKIEDKSNFVLGHYEVAENNIITTYSIDFNSTINVDEFNKEYEIFGVNKSENDLSSGTVKTTPIILVNNYDVVDAFRRMPTEDEDDFQELQNLVKGLSKDEVNYELNRWIKDYINNVNEYFE